MGVEHEKYASAWQDAWEEELVYLVGRGGPVGRGANHSMLSGPPENPGGSAGEVDHPGRIPELADNSTNVRASQDPMVRTLQALGVRDRNQQVLTYT